MCSESCRERHRIPTRQDEDTSAVSKRLVRAAIPGQGRERIDNPEVCSTPSPMWSHTRPVVAGCLNPERIISKLFPRRHFPIGHEIAPQRRNLLAKLYRGHLLRDADSRPWTDSRIGLLIYQVQLVGGSLIKGPVREELKTRIVLNLSPVRITRFNASTLMRFVRSSKPNTASSVTTGHIPPAGRPASRRDSPPRMNPGLVMKSTFSTKRRFSCFIATIIFVRLEMSLPPPVPGSRVLGAKGLPMKDEFRLPN